MGEDGIPGPASLVDLSPEPPGENCRFGGTRIQSGIDANADGVLNPQEVGETAFACNGGGLPLPSLVNGSFETGDFSDWLTQDLASPFNPLVVSTQAAKDGGFGVLTGFDGSSTSNPLVNDQRVDISAVSNQPVRIKFQWLVPENFTGPAEAHLDDVKLVVP